MKHRLRHFPRRPPPWWPAGESWPPAGPLEARRWRHMRGKFFWRVGGLLALMFVLTVGGCTLAFWLAFVGLGMLNLPSGTAPVLLFGSAAVALLGIGLITGGFRRVAVPIGDLLEATGRVAAGDYAVRLAERGPREMRAVARSFNSMAARLQRNEAQRRSLLADVTHELRTPLTVMQGNLEGLLDGVYPRDDAHLSPILEEMRVMSRLIDDLRTLALADSGGLQLHREPTDLAVLASETAASFRPQAEAVGVALDVDAGADLPLLEIDPGRIREVLSNLIANALRYTPPGGRIRVAGQVGDGRQAASEAGAVVTVSVSDDGAGIPPDLLPHVFDRFYRSPESGGTGLGLAIAKDLVAAHGGAIEAQSAPGQGTTIRFTLPLEAN